jgi:hypothetical protein
MFIWKNKEAAGSRRNNMRPITALVQMFGLMVLTLGMAQAQDQASYDAAKNTWLLQYQDPETLQWVRKTYVQQNAISPVLNSTVSGQVSGTWVYRYQVTNRRHAKQLLDSFRIWGIPLIYKVPNLPPVTASAFKDPEIEDKQQWAQLAVKRNFEKSILKAPRGWTAALRVDEQVGQTSLVWTPGLKDSDPDGIAIGRSQDGFMVLRPELPGVARAKLTGSTEEPWGLDHLPETPFWNNKIQEIQSRDFVLVPVLAPVIPIPNPYNAAQLARSLQAHTQTWLKYEHVNAEMQNRLNRQFDVLIPALNNGHQRLAAATIDALIKESRQHQAALSDAMVEADDPQHGSVPKPKNSPQAMPGRPAAMDRIAARALIFNLRYIRARLDLR